MKKPICSLLWTGAAIAAFTFPLAAQEALTPINSEETPATRAAAAVDTRTFGERLYDSAFDMELPAVESDEMQTETSTLDSEPSPAQGQSAQFLIPGEFLVGSRNNMNWQYDMFIGETRSFRKIIVDVDFVMGTFGGRVNNDQTNYGRDYYCVFWLNAGSQWTNAIAYLNYLFPGSQLENQSNIGGYWDPPNYGLRLSTGCRPEDGHSYHVHYEYDAENSVQGFTVTEGGQTRCAAVGFAGESPRITHSYFFIQFGSQYAPEGPEGYTQGWRFSNARMQFIGDNPIPTGRRPRRR
jgi:hypothetical protein